MTTIATDGKSMAGDGQLSTNGTICSTTAVKVFRLADGSLYGSVGGSGWGERHMAWLNGGQVGESPKGDDCDGFMWLKLDGTLWQGGCDGIPNLIELPFAMGTGMDFAIGAMEAGADPVHAVEIASRRDRSTGGQITVLHLHDNVRSLEAA